ncbi:acetoacetyl-CoA reductase [Permianibacter aggregans]|uniref:2,3-dihydroxy-2,3-dihydro-p-cumate dehydrogenase n=1 Tax=Permianibacter aggregans TaxID=1510150 RepID=A0A4R6UTP9_9GAMM|nr:acetoacetyl-CoA reductase [Permianibacter aggregans]QGX38748.1 acetoacetyl-CoA reductase [Permianibacter aggregans]TDQ50551.1 3-oxoacyl-[acyl-carrier-protein] reductase [Permianibacter aggregans]
MTKRVALVTGGTGGIGTAICQQLAKIGYQVAAGYNSGGDHEKARAWQAEQKAAGFNIAISFGDVRDFDSCGRCVAEVEEMLGPIDILVNNAGITRDSTLRKMSKEQWDAVLTSNLDSVFNMTRHVINGMVDRTFGRIVNVSSVNAQKGQLGQTNYAAAKSGIHGFTKALAQEVARKGVTVNTVSPGYIATKMVMAVPDEIRAEIIKGIPVGRLGEPEEIARAVAFLIDDTSGFITGANLAVNGGQHMF